MENIDVKIQRLQNEVEFEKMMPTNNCVKLATMQMQLANLYRSNGDDEKAKQTLEDAVKVLADSGCPPSRQRRALLNQLSIVLGARNSSSGTPSQYGLNVVHFPIYMRYSGLIFLAVGYLALYLLSSFNILTNGNYYTIGIYVIFVSSMVFSFLVRRMVMRKYRHK